MSRSGCSMFKNLPSSRLLKQVARLNLIAGTPETAYRFDSKFRKIEVLLIQKSIHGPSIGLKKFWRQNLPVLKFHNYDVNFNMTRISTQESDDLAKVPAKIIVYGEDGSRTELDCANKHSSEIFKMLVDATGATPVPVNEIPHVKSPLEESYSI